MAYPSPSYSFKLADSVAVASPRPPGLGVRPRVRNRGLASRTCPMLLAAIVMVAFHCGTVGAQYEGDFEHLGLVAKGMQANADAIRTWEGSARIVDERRTESGLSVESTAFVDFSYDAVREAVRWNAAIVRGNEGNAHADDADSILGRMVINNELHQFGPYPQPYELRREVRITAHEKRPIDGLSDDFHPFYFLEAVQEMPMTDFLLSVAADARDSDIHLDGVRVTVERTEDTVSLSYDYTNGPQITDVFHVSMGCNLVSHRNAVGDNLWTYEFDYAHFGDVFVPSRWKYNYESPGPSGVRSTEFAREVVFLEQRVNEPVPEESFSLERLGLGGGDRVRDKIRDIECLLPEDGEDHSHARPVGMKSRPPRSGERNVLIALNVAVLGVVLVLAALLRMRSKRREG